MGVGVSAAPKMASQPLNVNAMTSSMMTVSFFMDVFSKLAYFKFYFCAWPKLLRSEERLYRVPGIWQVVLKGPY
jgi:hypothetical protein